MTQSHGQTTALASWMLGLVQHTASAGIDIRPMFDELGLDWQALEQPNARYPVYLTTQLWQKCVQATGDEAIGLKVIRHITPTTFSSVGMGILASLTLRDAFTRLSKFGDLISDASQIDLVDHADGVASLQINLRPGANPADQATDGLMALLANTGRALGMPALKPIEVWLTRAAPKPSTVSYFERVFDTNILFSQPKLALLFDVGVIDKPLRSGNPIITDHLDAASLQALEALKTRAGVDLRVRDIIKSSIEAGLPTATDDVASKLHMSARNLQRKLAEEGTSVAAIIDDIRREETLLRLKDPNSSLTMIAIDLGFSDASAFNRACKRWFGKPPSQLR